MDISQTYIEMCRAATEIQEMRVSNEQMKDGDVLFNHIREKSGIYDEMSSTYFNAKKSTNETWLPRQDQLQAMLFGQSMESQMNTLRTFYHNPAVFSVKKTWEQLWLSIVMKSNYGKEYDPGKKQWIGGLWQ